MLKKRNIVVLIMILSLFNVTVFTATAQVVPVDKLSAVEILIYGEQSNESILNRVVKLENTLYGTEMDGSLIERSNNIYYYVLGNQDNSSLMFKLNGLEWSLTTDITQDTLVNKLDRLENMVFGEKKTGALEGRIDYLINITFPKGNISYEGTEIPKDTLIKIKTFDKISSESSKTGDKVRFEVSENVYVNSKLVIPAGSTGILGISQVEKSGNLGKEGKINLNFSKLMTIDGSELQVTLDEEAQVMNRSQQLALGASILGAAVLGPIGLVAGYFVKGNEEVLPKGSELYLQSVKAKSVIGLSME